MNTRTFGRKRDSRELLLRNLATSVILHESVVTTDAKGRTIQPIIDRLIRTGQSENKLNARRQLMAYLLDEKAVVKILEELAPRMSDRTSGFTRRYRVAPRHGDGSPQVMIQLTKTVLVNETEAAPKASTKTASKAEEVKAEEVAPAETATEGESNE